MNIQCPNCKHEGTVPDDKVPDSGLSVNCPKCSTKFQITSQLSPISKPEIYCPKCGTGQVKSDACTNCGIIFYKFLNSKTDNKPGTKQKFPSNNNINKLYAIVCILVVATAISIVTINSQRKTPPKENNNITTVYSITPVAPYKVAESESTFSDIEFSHVDAYWYQRISAVCVPTIKLKVRNNGNKKLKHMPIRAVFLQNDSSVFTQLDGSFNDLDPGITSECLRLSSRKGYVTYQGVRGKTLTLNLYATMNGDEKLVRTITLTDAQVKHSDHEDKDFSCVATAPGYEE